MAKVRILVQPTGCINGREWPAVGELFDLADSTADAMAEAGWVEVVKAATKKVEKRPAAKKGEEKR